MTSVTVSIWHNVAHDQAGRHTAPLDGFTPGDPMVRVFTYQATPRGRSPEAIAEDAFALANGHPRDDETARLSRLYYQRRLRSLSVGDVVAVGEVPLAVGRVGWTLVRGLNEVRTSEHGTHPLPSRLPDTGDHTAIPCPDQGAT
ncbi:MAG TPA: hypothetical protein VMV07_16520 [Streptosporangiaceae bacterium]|nr:hypothetical protein [Streptosporangiaceae bacterium]